MILFDTDHVSVLASPGSRAAELGKRVHSSGHQDYAISIVSIEEQMRGWLAEIHRRKVSEQLFPYARLGSLISFWNIWRILPFDEAAAVQFQLLRSRVRIGTQDLKIASIALTHRAKLVTANAIDFERTRANN